MEIKKAIELICKGIKNQNEIMLNEHESIQKYLRIAMPKNKKEKFGLWIKKWFKIEYFDRIRQRRYMKEVFRNSIY